jgi:hypothetical protein
MKTIQAVKCESCGALHDADKNEYITATMRVDYKNQIIIDEEDSVFCPKCFVEYLASKLDGITPIKMAYKLPIVYRS